MIAGLEGHVYVCVCMCGHLRCLCRLVKLRQLHQSVFRHVSVQHAVDERRDGGENEVEEDQNPRVGHHTPRETTEELIPEQQVHIGLKNM